MVRAAPPARALLGLGQCGLSHEDKAERHFSLRIFAPGKNAPEAKLRTLMRAFGKGLVPM